MSSGVVVWEVVLDVMKGRAVGCDAGGVDGRDLGRDDVT